MILRPYQENAVNSLRSIIASGKRRVVLYLPTGGGKTEVGIEMIRLALGKRKKALFVSNRIELVKQSSDRLAMSEVQHGIIQGSNTCFEWEPVQVCSIQTLDKRGYPPADLIILDEAHGTAGSKSYRRFMEAHKDIPIIGLTATPFAKGMSKKYEWGTMWEHLHPATTIKELIELGFLVDCDIYAPGEPDLSKVKIVAGDYHEKQLGEAVDKTDLIGDIVEHWKKLGNGKPTVIFATNIAHSKHIVEQFQNSSISAEHIDCYTDDSERKKILDRVHSGQTKVVSNVGVLSEGWDCPKVEVMILARPTRSLIRYIQMAGRILRPFPGKERGLILDHSGTAKRLGFPTDDLPLILDDGKPKDKKAEDAKERTREEQLPIICPACSLVMAKRNLKCPRCGHERYIKKAEFVNEKGDLVLLSKEKKVRSKIATAEKSKVYSELMGYAAQRGFKKGWAWHKCRELFGSAPKIEPQSSLPSPETLNLIKHLNIRRAKRKYA